MPITSSQLIATAAVRTLAPCTGQREERPEVTERASKCNLMIGRANAISKSVLIARGMTSEGLRERGQLGDIGSALEHEGGEGSRWARWTFAVIKLSIEARSASTWRSAMTWNNTTRRPHESTRARAPALSRSPTSSLHLTPKLQEYTSSTTLVQSSWRLPPNPRPSPSAASIVSCARSALHSAPSTPPSPQPKPASKQRRQEHPRLDL